ncbi:uncharacterized protein LOC143584038 [Bidens hawaiensis]|uniref:uncharacterized protein LOC143584038 n=1 Tax=Bidens hawaiensis TaxID=980011 RepID=UPI004049988D
MKAKSNIQELIPHGKSSFLDGLLSEYIDGDQNAKSSSNSNRKGTKRTSKVRKSSYLLRPFAKETREMARKRARERTLEKNNKLACVSGDDDQFSKFNPCLDLTMDQGVNSFGSWIINQPEQPLQNKGVSPTIGLSGWNNPSFLYNYHHSGVHPQEMHQFSNFQIHGNLWDFNN